MKRLSKPRVVRGEGWIRISLAQGDPLAFWGAAYQLMGRAHAVVERLKGRLSVTLWPKSGRSAAALEKIFILNYEDQLGRWRVERKNIDVRAEVLRRALLMAENAGAEPRADSPSLSPEQKEEIARMLAEAEAAPADPFGIAASWRQRGSR